MKKVSIGLIVVGIILIICGNLFYGHHPNAVDNGGSSEITTFAGHWSVKVPAFLGGVLLVLGCIFYYVSTFRIEKHKVHHDA